MMLLLDSPANNFSAVNVISLRWHNTALTKLNIYFGRSQLVRCLKYNAVGVRLGATCLILTSPPHCCVAMRGFLC